MKNQIIEYDDYAELILQNKYGYEVGRVLIDLEDIELLSDIRWCLYSNRYAYNKRIGYLHRFLMNPPEGYVVDHINHNMLDNRKCNLRVCTQHQNTMNRGARKDNQTGVKGVTKSGNNYLVRIVYNGQCIYLGTYNTIEEASHVYQEKARELFGEYNYEPSNEVH